jgi:hypothetical protein
VPQAVSSATEAIASPTVAPRAAVRIRIMVLSLFCAVQVVQ